MFRSAFSSITKMLIKKASLNFKVANTVKSLSEHKPKHCGPNSVNRLGMQDVMPLQNWTIFFLRHLKRRQLEKNGEFSSCLKKLSSASMCTFPS